MALLQVYIKDHGYIEEFGKENVVFLTAESSNTLTGEYKFDNSLRLSL